MLLAWLKIKLNVFWQHICWWRLCDVIKRSRTATGWTDRVRLIEVSQTRLGKLVLTGISRMVGFGFCPSFFWEVSSFTMRILQMKAFPLTGHVFHYCQGQKHTWDTWGKVPSAQKHQRERESLRDLVSFQNKGNSGGSGDQEAGLWLEGCHIPSITS